MCISLEVSHSKLSTKGIFQNIPMFGRKWRTTNGLCSSRAHSDALRPGAQSPLNFIHRKRRLKIPRVKPSVPKTTYLSLSLKNIKYLHIKNNVNINKSSNENFSSDQTIPKERLYPHVFGNDIPWQYWNTW